MFADLVRVNAKIGEVRTSQGSRGEILEGGKLAPFEGKCDSEGMDTEPFEDRSQLSPKKRIVPVGDLVSEASVVKRWAPRVRSSRQV